MTPPAWVRTLSAGVLGSLVVAAGGLLGGHPAVAAEPGDEVRRSMPNVWWYDAMNLAEVHQTATGEGVKVAVIDGYLDPTVPDLRGARISKGDSCRGEPVPYLSGELASHGTAMTTAIVGQGANGKGIVGVAPDAELRFYSFDTDPREKLVECDALLIAKQIDKAVAWGADVISMSIGTGGGLEESIAEAWDAGAVVVAASGEVYEGEDRGAQSIEKPADMPGVVAVAAATSQAKVWSQNPYSADFQDEYLTVAAPGVEVPLGGFPEGSQEWLAGGIRTGTSPATAITAGAFAVLKSRWPEATGNQLIQAVIHHTGGKDDDELVYDKVQGYGVLALNGTLEVDPTGYPDENPLLVPPPEAMKAYPASSYDLDQADAEQAADDGSSEDTGSSTVGSSSGDTDPASDSSIPAWAVVTGALVLLGLVVGALLLRRRTSAVHPGTPPGAGDQTTDTTYDRTAPRGS